MCAMGVDKGGLGTYIDTEGEQAPMYDRDHATAISLIATDEYESCAACGEIVVFIDSTERNGIVYHYSCATAAPEVRS